MPPQAQPALPVQGADMAQLFQILAQIAQTQGAQRLQGQQAQLQALDPLGTVARANSRLPGLTPQDTWNSMFNTGGRGNGTQSLPMAEAPRSSPNFIGPMPSVPSTNTQVNQPGRAFSWETQWNPGEGIVQRQEVIPALTPFTQAAMAELPQKPSPDSPNYPAYANAAQLQFQRMMNARPQPYPYRPPSRF